MYEGVIFSKCVFFAPSSCRLHELSIGKKTLHIMSVMHDIKGERAWAVAVLFQPLTRLKLVPKRNFRAGISLLLFPGLDAQYIWSCSPLDVELNRYYLPSLPPASSINTLTVGLSDLDVIHIFPLPPNLNCSGTVSEIKYCYDTNETDGFDVFTLLILNQNGLTFT